MQLYTPVFLTTLFRSWSKVGVNSTIGNHDNAQPSPSINIPLLDQHKLQAQYRHAQQRSFLLDYDGTLTPIVDDPEAAIPSKKLLRTLQALASDPKNAVWIISGRDQAFLDQWLGSIEQIGLSAEHGAFVRKPGSTTWDDVERDDLGWQKEIVEMFQAYTERTPGSFVERKRVAVTWHFRKADLDEGARHAVECRTRLEDMIATKNWDLEVMNGKMNLEVRPVSVSKGDIVKKLVESRNGAGDLSLDFVLCLGDDFTDEGKYIDHEGVSFANIAQICFDLFVQRPCL